MLDAILMTAALVMPMDSADRQINLQRPSRSGAYSSPIREAATIPPKHRAWAECVLRRESGGVIHNKQSREDARNRSSSASGRWQMLDSSGWREGVGWLVQKRLVKFGIPKESAVRVRKHLQATPIWKIDGFWQDIAFIQSVEEGGKRHWYNGGDKCDKLGGM